MIHPRGDGHLFILCESGGPHNVGSTRITGCQKSQYPTENTMKKCKQFLDYAATQEDAVITYRKSDMVLAIHSDASYLSEPKARSRAGGHFFLSENDEDPRDNGAVHTVAKIIKAVMSSAAEAELGGLPKQQYRFEQH
jgi:hypothetical protein